MPTRERSGFPKEVVISQVDTVLGVRDTRELGAVLMHEHIFVHTPEISRDYPELSWGDKDEVIDDAVRKLADLKARDFDTLVDLTAIGCDRAIPEIQRVNSRVDINIIVATGLYTFDELPRFVRARPARSDGGDVLAEMFVRDITHGIADTGVRAGILKCCTDTPGVTPNVDRVLRATARAHRETGVPISTHSNAALRTGRLQQDVFSSEGVELSRVVIGHCGDTTDLDYLRGVMDRGSFIGCDRFGLYQPGTPTLDERVDVIARLCAEGYADRIVLSHDANCQSDWLDEHRLANNPEWNYTHLPDRVIPALRKRGVPEIHLRQLLVDNPRRIFEAQGGY